MSDPREDHPARRFFIDEGKKWVARGVFALMTIFFVTILTPYGNQIQEIWNEPGARQDADLAIIETQRRILDSQREIMERLEKLSGEDRVIRQPSNMSFVREPVGAEDTTLELIIFIERTRLGEICILEELTPKYIDSNNVAVALDPRPARNQLVGVTGLQRLVLKLDRPVMPTGRTGVLLQLRYECSGRIIYDNTDIVFFYNN